MGDDVIILIKKEYHKNMVYPLYIHTICIDIVVVMKLQQLMVLPLPDLLRHVPPSILWLSALLRQYKILHRVPGSKVKTFAVIAHEDEQFVVGERATMMY